MMTARPYIVTPDTAPSFWQIRNLWRVMATGIQTGGSFCALDQLVSTDGGGPSAHTHTQDEGMYLVSGHCTYNAAGQVIPAGSGSFVAIPRHTEHSFVVDAPGTQLLNFYLPAGFEMILMSVAVPAERNDLPPPDADVQLPPRRLVEQLNRDYGVTEVLGKSFADPPSENNMVTKPTSGARVHPFRSDVATSPSYWHANGLFTVLADGPSTNDSYCLLEQLLPKDWSASPHLHEWADEVFYILDGEAEFLLDDRIDTAGKNALVFIPKGTVHALRIKSETARLLNLYTPAGFERSVAMLGEPTQLKTLPPLGWTQPEVADDQRARLFADIGMRPVAVLDPFRS